MPSLMEVLMKRDGLSRDAAFEEVESMKQRVLEGEDPEDVLYDIGLEPDYILDIID